MVYALISGAYYPAGARSKLPFLFLPDTPSLLQQTRQFFPQPVKIIVQTSFPCDECSTGLCP